MRIYSCPIRRYCSTQFTHSGSIKENVVGCSMSNSVIGKDVLIHEV